jgi:phosphoglycerol transferase
LLSEAKIEVRKYMSKKLGSFYLILPAIIMLFIIGIFIYTNNINLYQQLQYDGDALVSAMSVKTVIDNGWFFTNPYLSAPTIFNMADFPLVESFHFILIKIISIFSHNYAVVINIFYLLTFPLITLSAFYVFQRLGLNYLFSIPASLLFAFLPDHFWRGESHLFLSAYYAVPLYILFAYEVFTKPPFVKKSGALKQVCYIVITIAAASTGVYYAFFGAFFILIAGIVSSINYKKFLPFLNALIFISIISITVIINVTPNIIYHTKHGDNANVATRLPQESEAYGLKIDQMLFPITGHRLAFLNEFKTKYDSTTPLSGTGSLDSIGTIASIGFISLIIFLLIRKRSFFDNQDSLYFISIMNISAILLATVGGFGSIFAYLISPQIRCYDRMNIFIGFFGLFAFFLIVQKVITKKKKSIFIASVIAFSLLIFGIWDQIAIEPFKNLWNSPLVKAEFQSDSDYAKQIEALMSKNAMIFQLPHIPFPEDSTGYYLPAKQYLHSHTLKWSYGSMRGRTTNDWSTKVSNQAISEMLSTLSFAGFSGLSIDRVLYKNNAAELEKQLSNTLHQQPLVSQNGRLAFYDIRPYTKELKKSLAAEKWNEQTKKTSLEFLTNFNWTNGFHSLEQSAKESWRWCDNKGELKIANNTNKNINMKLNFTIKTGYPEPAVIMMTGPLINEKVIADFTGTYISRIVTIPPGISDIKFATDAKKLNVSERRIFFGIFDFTAETES